MAANKAKISKAIKETFPSDVLLELWTLVCQIPALKSVFPRLVRVIIVIDANIVHRELEFRLRKRQKAKARSSLTEVIQSGAWIAIAPPFLDQEIEEHIPKIALRCLTTEERVRDEWRLIRSLFRYCEPRSKARIAELSTDPKDVPYARLREEFGADAVFSCDSDFPKMGVPVVTVKFDTLVRDYSRSKAMEVGITLASGTSLTISVELLVASVKSCLALWKRLPETVKFAVAATATAAFLHPRSRHIIVENCRSLLKQVRAFGPPMLELAAELCATYASARQEAKELENRVLASLPERNKVPAVVLARRICLAEKTPLLLRELESRILEEGYISKSKSFRTYLLRLLRGDTRFLEDSSGRWALASLS